MSRQPRFVHLHCLYCGGERRGDDSACKKCLAAAPSVPCRRCRAQVFAPREVCICGEPCSAWGAATGDDHACPRCRGRLHRADLTEAGVHVEQCARCLGCFVRTLAFSELVSQESTPDVALADTSARRLPAAFMPPSDLTPLPRQARLDEVRCPHCARVMDRVRFANKATIVVDVCPTHGVWLDAGELPRILQHVRRVARGEVTREPAELADDLRWTLLVQEKLTSEQRTATRLASNTEKETGPSRGAVALGTAIGGPWVGLFLAMRRKGTK